MVKPTDFILFSSDFYFCLWSSSNHVNEDDDYYYGYGAYDSVMGYACNLRPVFAKIPTYINQNHIPKKTACNCETDKL